MMPLMPIYRQVTLTHQQMLRAADTYGMHPQLLGFLSQREDSGHVTMRQWIKLSYIMESAAFLKLTEPQVEVIVRNVLLDQAIISAFLHFRRSS